MESAKTRLVILASSGLVLCAAVLSCWRDHAPNFLMDNNPFAHKKLTAPQSAEAPLAPGERARIPATSLSDASKSAKLNQGRVNPMAPVALASGRPPSLAISLATKTSGDETMSRRTKPYQGFRLPPPPAIPVAQQVAVSSTAEMELPAPPAKPTEPKALSVDDVRLVGIVDGRAFFTVPKRIAQQFSIPHQFTLGAGEQMDSIAVDSVASSSAKLHDGQKVAVKELSSIR